MVKMDNISSSKSWALIVPIIDATFLLDFCPFLLEVIGVSKSSLYFFQAHFEVGMGIPSSRCADLHSPFMSLYKNEYIGFIRAFQIDYMTILSLASFLKWLLICITHVQGPM
jgi:hypothetical protein